MIHPSSCANEPGATAHVRKTTLDLNPQVFANSLYNKSTLNLHKAHRR